MLGDQPRDFVHATQTLLSTDPPVWSLKTSSKCSPGVCSEWLLNGYPSPLPHLAVSSAEKDGNRQLRGTVGKGWTPSCEGLWESYLVPAALDW